MASKYKLTYFPKKGMAEPIRFLLTYGNIEYEDNRVSKEEWVSKVKKTAPFGKMPILEVDGKVLHQHGVICRYLAKQLNILGRNDWEIVDADAIVTTVMDISPQFQPLIHEQDETAKTAKIGNLRNNILPLYFEKFDEIIKENGGYFVGGQLTWADLYFVAMLDQMLAFTGEDYLTSYPNIKKLQDKICNLPQIKKWISIRPSPAFLP